MKPNLKRKPPTKQNPRQSKKSQVLVELFSPDDRWLTTAAAAEFMSKSVYTLRSWRVNNHGPMFYGSGGNVRYRQSDCAAYMQHNVRSVDDLRQE